MLKTIIIGSVFMAGVLAGNFGGFEIENSIGNYPVPYQIQGASLPYPYKDTRESRIVDPALYGYDVVVPPAPKKLAVAVSKIGIVAKVATTIFALAKKAMVFILTSGPALLIGTIAALALCKFTPICTKFSDIKSLLSGDIELRSLASSENLTGVAEFVHKAIKKYNAIQENEY